MLTESKFKTSVQKPDSTGREALFTAALRCFAVEGFDETTARTITAAAGMSLGSVNYYFGSKAGLMYEVFDDVARESTESRMVEYGILEKAAENGRPIQAEDVFRALIKPYVEGDKYRRRVLVRIVLQHRVAPTDLTRQLMRTYFDRVATRSIDLLGAAAPFLTRRDVAWRYHLAIGTIQSVVRDVGSDNRLRRISNEQADASDLKALVDETVAFVVAGFMNNGPSQYSADPVSVGK